jgi:DNA-binding transcriptional regulator YhcF (GntR family)
MVATGALRAGDRLPSVRELALFSGANVNTARAAYATLEDEGLLESQQGRGTFVAERDERPGLAAAADRALAAAAEAGATPAELIAAIHARAAMPAPAVLDEGAARRILRAQIARLERELADYAWDDPIEAPPPGPVTARPAGAVAGSAELERTRDELLDRLSRLRSEAAARGDAEQAARLRRAEMEADPAAHAWEVVSAAEAGEAGSGEWQVVPRLGPLGAIMGWWRVRADDAAPRSRG